MGETKTWAIGVVVLCTLFTSVGTLVIKTGVDRFAMSWRGLLAAYPVIVGLFFYFLGFILLTIAFRHGELSVLYPFVSLSFVWVAALSYVFLKEAITPLEIFGVVSIVLGVVIIGMSSRNGRRLRLRG